MRASLPDAVGAKRFRSLYRPVYEPALNGGVPACGTDFPFAGGRGVGPVGGTRFLNSSTELIRFRNDPRFFLVAPRALTIGCNDVE